MKEKIVSFLTKMRQLVMGSSIMDIGIVGDFGVASVSAGMAVFYIIGESLTRDYDKGMLWACIFFYSLRIIGARGSLRRMTRKWEQAEANFARRGLVCRDLTESLLTAEADRARCRALENQNTKLKAQLKRVKAQLKQTKG